MSFSILHDFASTDVDALTSLNSEVVYIQPHCSSN